MLCIGKHRGSTYEEVASRDRAYCAWVLSLPNPSPGLLQFVAYLQETHGGVLEVGAYRGAFFDDVRRDHPHYCDWVTHLDNPTGTLQRFATYLRRETEISHEFLREPWTVMSDREDGSAPKRPRTTEACEPVPSTRTWECKICLVSTIRTCFTPCGHMVACVECARRIAHTRCPICRATIREVVETFAV